MAVQRAWDPAFAGEILVAGEHILVQPVVWVRAFRALENLDVAARKLLFEAGFGEDDEVAEGVYVLGIRGEGGEVGVDGEFNVCVEDDGFVRWGLGFEFCCAGDVYVVHECSAGALEGGEDVSESFAFGEGECGEAL